MNTFFRHQETHKWTWYRWNKAVMDNTDKSMIDLVLVSQKKIISDVKAVPLVSVLGRELEEDLQSNKKLL